MRSALKNYLSKNNIFMIPISSSIFVQLNKLLCQKHIIEIDIISLYNIVLYVTYLNISLSKSIRIRLSEYFLQNIVIIRTLFWNILNVVEGFKIYYSKFLKFVGLGFKIKLLKNDKIKVKIGFSHYVKIYLPYNFLFRCEKYYICIYYYNKPKLEQIICRIIAMAKPNLYTAKGIKNFYSFFRTKIGKRTKR